MMADIKITLRPHSGPPLRCSRNSLMQQMLSSTDVYQHCVVCWGTDPPVPDFVNGIL